MQRYCFRIISIGGKPVSWRGVSPARAGGGAKIATAFDRVELISDALTAILTARAGFTVVTEDSDFDLLSQYLPG